MAPPSDPLVARESGRVFGLSGPNGTNRQVGSSAQSIDKLGPLGRRMRGARKERQQLMLPAVGLY